MTTGMTRHKRRKLKSEINVVPYIDVMLVLLIIFMVTAPLLTLSVDVKLPSSNARSTSDQKEPVIVIAYPDGSLGLKLPDDEVTRRVDAEQLEAMLRPMRQQQGDSMRVMVAGEADASFQYVMTAMSILQRAGINNVSLMSKTGSNAR